MSQGSSPPDLQYLGEDDSDYFRFIHGRSLNALNTTYMLPVDEDEIKVNFISFSRPRRIDSRLPPQRSELHHRMLQFVFHGKNYIGPVKRALQFGERRRGAILVFPPAHETRLSSS